MEIKVESPLKVDSRIKTIDKLMILVYNLLLLAGASYLVYFKDASAWLFILALVFAGSWKSDKETKDV